MSQFIFLSGLILLAALCRLIPHWPNFTPIGAMALVGGAWFSRKYLAFLVPIAALYLSDLLLNNIVYAEYYQGLVWGISPFTYGAFALIVVLGLLLRGRVRPRNVLLASLGASSLFFLVSNFGVWMVDPFYPKNAAGLLAAYTAGIPFFWNTLAGDLFFSAVLFGAYAYAAPQVATRKARV